MYNFSNNFNISFNFLHLAFSVISICSHLHLHYIVPHLIRINVLLFERDMHSSRLQHSSISADVLDVFLSNPFLFFLSLVSRRERNHSIRTSRTTWRALFTDQWTQWISARIYCSPTCRCTCIGSERFPRGKERGLIGIR